MRILTLLLFCTCTWSSAAAAQDTEPADGVRIESAEVLGIPDGQLSPGLQRDIQGLAGKALARPDLTQLARRIEEERPDVVVALRIDTRDNGEARVLFLVASISNDAGLGSNINARYIVERVDIEGIEEGEISQGLRDRLQALVGSRLDPAQAEALAGELRKERPGYDVSRRVERGTRRGQIRVVFEFSESEGLRWLPFAPSRSKFVYHSGEGWSGLLDIPMGNRDHRVTVGVAMDDNDTLIEEYSGARLRFETRHLGTERLGASLEASWFNTSWRPETLAALGVNPQVPGPYRNRWAVDPSVTAALSRHVRVSGGLSLSSLESLHHAPASQMASVVTGAVDYRHEWRGNRRTRQSLESGYGIRWSADGLGSDFSYRRHLGYVRYRFDTGDHAVIANGFVGGITGEAPLFERFTLGDSTTLRGWNKFEFAPIGGDRAFHQSLEYRFHGASIYFDSGSVWDDGRSREFRAATGFGWHSDNFFITVAFPLDAPETDATFMIGVRF
jgi:hypothetical protein